MSLIRALLTTCAVVLIGSAVGCNSKPKTSEIKAPTGKTAAQLLLEGEALMKRAQWEEGRKSLRTIEDYFPATPEFAKAKIMLGDSFFFANSTSYPEALVEYQSFLNYFPRHEAREYALYRIAMCYFASIENAERDQTQTRKAIEALQAFLQEAPGSPYAVDGRAKLVQCYRRLAETELMVGIFYVNNMQYGSSERRLKELLEQYPEYVDRERAYYYLGEALRNKYVPREKIENCYKDWLAKRNLDQSTKLDKIQEAQWLKDFEAYSKEETGKYRQEARTFYQRLVESYPNSVWTGRAKDRLLEMGTSGVKEELDS